MEVDAVAEGLLLHASAAAGEVGQCPQLGGRSRDHGGVLEERQPDDRRGEGEEADAGVEDKVDAVVAAKVASALRRLKLISLALPILKAFAQG